MDKARNIKHHRHVDHPDPIGARFEYDRADEKRKIHEEIEEVLEERIKPDSPEQR